MSNFVANKFAADLAATTLTELTASANSANGQAVTAGTHQLNLCNRTGSAISVRVAITKAGVNAPALADYVEWDAPLEPNGVLARWPIPMGDGWKVFVQASAVGVSANLLALQG
ncbi:hypothetical protein BHAOGJBA_1691 [Methylobacterium hispanicum]|uniref:Uncharacterized protein n=1 Tax=Methylobacterium hispanicum TaxID=270350 RepID=A0AAV4ZIM1_9HYPH|nr:MULTISPECIES: hypothetical protein [Methylobacterium]GJD88178.1 hypothetical protein BHAOGJBA_1691 [Methylobacterium hispanicum]